MWENQSQSKWSKNITVLVIREKGCNPGKSEGRQPLFPDRNTRRESLSR